MARMGVGASAIIIAEEEGEKENIEEDDAENHDGDMSALSTAV